MSDFNLRHLVREVLDTSTMADPGDLADEVSRRIDDCDLRAAIDQALRSIVRQEITRGRMRHGVPEESHREVPTQAPLIHGAPVSAAARPGPAMQLVAKQIPARSSKVAGIRDWWAGELRNPIHVGEKRWLPLGDCSFDDLMFAAGERRDQAERNAARAKSFTRLANAVAAAGVGRVRDLPAEALRAHFGGVAA